MNSEAGDTEERRKGWGWFGWLAVVLAAAVVSHANASDIRLKNGASYTDVTILSQTPTQLSVQTHFGTMTLPLAEISSIDGVPFGTHAPSRSALAPAAAVSASPQSSSAHAGSPAPAASAPENPEASPEGSPSPSPSPGLEAASSGPPYVHVWRMDVFLAVCAAFAFGWLALMARGQRELRESSSGAIGWNIFPFLLPVVGYPVFKAGRYLSSFSKRGGSSPTGLERSAPPPESNLRFVAEAVHPEPKKEDPDTSGIETARRLLDEAVAARTSDVHIEPQQNEYRVRFRVDGVLEERAVLEKQEGIRVVSALKAQGQIDVAEKRKAQDGRFRTRIGDRDVDMRISTATSIFGEKMVIRILDQKGGVFGLAELGMSQEMIDQFDSAIHSRSGMILATGPTGAGKTSTLYAAISQLDRKRLNIMTIEDPVEYKLDGVTQIPVNTSAGVTYESGLRSILRQDPDVILVGEMRDAEAAKIAMRAALTGTLMFSSLHTKDTVSTILRLGEMGVESSQMGSALLALIAQRLVRVLCTACREPYESTPEILYDIGIEMPAGETIYRAKGCPECSQTGYLGRTGIFELMVFDDETRLAVSNQMGQAELLELARARGFYGYRESGAQKILMGITTVQEVLEAG